jgi:hypothetical protein
LVADGDALAQGEEGGVKGVDWGGEKRRRRKMRGGLVDVKRER